MPYGADPTEAAASGGYGKDRPDKQPDQTQEQPPSALAALFRGFLHGMGDVVHGGAQLGARMGPEIGDATTTPQQQQGLINRVDQAAQQREQAYQSDPRLQGGMRGPAAAIGRFGGNVASTLPLAVGPAAPASIPMRLGVGMATGAMGAAMSPVTSGGDYWQEKAKQTLMGAGTGGAVSGAGRMIGPPLQQGAQNAIVNFPHIASLVRGTAVRSPDNFNRAAVAQALDPIGAEVPRNLKAGNGLIQFAEDRLTDAYNKVLPHIALRGDPEFMLKGMADIRAAGDDIVIPASRQAFDDFLKKNIEKPLADSRGVLDGEAVKTIESKMGRAAANMRRSSDAGQQEIGEALYGARDAVLEAVARQNPEYATGLRNANRSYAMFARIRDAATKDVDAAGVFTPHHLLLAARSGDKSAGKGSFATGDAAMQAVGQAGLGPMTAPKVNRLLTSALGSALGFAAEGGPHGLGAGAIAGSLAPDALRLGIRATQHPASRAAGRGVSGMAPAAGAAAGRAGDRMKAQRKVSELQSNLYAAKRRGDMDGAQKLQAQLAEADADYRKLRPNAQ